MAAVLEPQLPLVPDSTLIERVAQHDSTALIELERRHRGSLYAQVYGILMDSSLAERVVRDVFSKAWFAADQLRQKRSAWAWLRETAIEIAREARDVRGPQGGTAMRQLIVLFAMMLVPSLLPAQTPPASLAHPTPTIPNEHASAIAHRATHTRGEAVGVDNRPVTPATRAIRATRAVPATPNPDGGPTTRATRAVRATPAVPASPSHRPTNPGQGHGRRP